MRQSSGSALIQIMACRLFDTKPLSEPALVYNKSIGTLGTTFSEMLIASHIFSLKKMHLNISSVNWWPCCPGGNELTPWGWNKWLTSCIQHFQLHFVQLISLYLDPNLPVFLRVYLTISHHWFNKWPNRWLELTFQVLWCHMSPLGHNELTRLLGENIFEVVNVKEIFAAHTVLADDLTLFGARCCQAACLYILLNNESS